MSFWTADSWKPSRRDEDPRQPSRRDDESRRQSQRDDEPHGSSGHEGERQRSSSYAGRPRPTRDEEHRRPNRRDEELHRPNRRDEEPRRPSYAGVQRLRHCTKTPGKHGRKALKEGQRLPETRGEARWLSTHQTDASRRLAERVLQKNQEMNAPKDKVESKPRTDAALPQDVRMSEESNAPEEDIRSGRQTEAASPLSDRMSEGTEEPEDEPDIIFLEPGVVFIDPVSFAVAKLTDQLKEEAMKDIMEKIARPAIVDVLERRSKDLDGAASQVSAPLGSVVHEANRCDEDPDVLERQSNDLEGATSLASAPLGSVVHEADRNENELRTVGDEDDGSYAGSKYQDSMPLGSVVHEAYCHDNELRATGNEADSSCAGDEGAGDEDADAEDAFESGDVVLVDEWADLFDTAGSDALPSVSAVHEDSCRNNEARLALYDCQMQDIQGKANNGDPCAQIITDLHSLFKAKSELYLQASPESDRRLHNQYEHQSAITVGEYSVTLASILSLQPGTTEQAWLDESLIDTLIGLYEADRTNADAYFCRMAGLQLYLSRMEGLDPVKVLQGAIDQVRNCGLTPCYGFPAADMPCNAQRMVFVYNPTAAHFVTVEVTVNKLTGTGTITLYNAGKRDSQKKAGATLARAREELPLLVALAGLRPQSPFRGITWSAKAVVEGESPQACDANVDCGPFSIDTAVQLLRGEAPDATHGDDASRAAYGTELRLRFLTKLRDCLLNAYPSPQCTAEQAPAVTTSNSPLPHQVQQTFRTPKSTNQSLRPRGPKRDYKETSSGDESDESCIMLSAMDQNAEMEKAKNIANSQGILQQREQDAKRVEDLFLQGDESAQQVKLIHKLLALGGEETGFRLETETDRLTLTAHDVNTLCRGIWLNDAIIAACLALRTPAGSRMDGRQLVSEGAITMCWDRLRNKDYANRDFAKMPLTEEELTERAQVFDLGDPSIHTWVFILHVGGNHWTACSVSVRDRTVRFYSSMRGYFTREKGNLERLVSIMVHAKDVSPSWKGYWRFEEAPCHQQENSDDCGVEAIENAIELLQSGAVQVQRDPNSTLRILRLVELRSHIERQLFDRGVIIPEDIYVDDSVIPMDLNDDPPAGPDDRPLTKLDDSLLSDQADKNALPKGRPHKMDGRTYNGKVWNRPRRTYREVIISVLQENKNRWMCTKDMCDAVQREPDHEHNHYASNRIQDVVHRNYAMFESRRRPDRETDTQYRLLKPAIQSKPRPQALYDLSDDLPAISNAAWRPKVTEKYFEEWKQRWTSGASVLDATPSWEDFLGVKSGLSLPRIWELWLSEIRAAKHHSWHDVFELYSKWDGKNPNQKAATSLPNSVSRAKKRYGDNFHILFYKCLESREWLQWEQRTRHLTSKVAPTTEPSPARVLQSRSHTVFVQVRESGAVRAVMKVAMLKQRADKIMETYRAEWLPTDVAPLYFNDLSDDTWIDESTSYTTEILLNRSSRTPVFQSTEASKILDRLNSLGEARNRKITLLCAGIDTATTDISSWARAKKRWPNLTMELVVAMPIDYEFPEAFPTVKGSLRWGVFGFDTLAVAATTSSPEAVFDEEFKNRQPVEQFTCLLEAMDSGKWELAEWRRREWQDKYSELQRQKAYKTAGGLKGRNTFEI